MLKIQEAKGEINMYRYCFIDRQTEEMLDVRCGTEAANQAITERGGKDDIFVQPIMLRSEYQSQPLEYRGEKDGMPCLLYMGVNGATTYGPVYLLDHWGKWSGEQHHTPFERPFFNARC